MSSEAVYGLLGVVVGGVIQGGGTWLLARRADRQLARGAARMTAGELLRGVYRIYDLLNVGVWGPVLERPLESPRWREYEPLFAATIVHDETWRDVYNAYRYFDHINELTSHRSPTQRLTDEERDELDRSAHLAIVGSLVLTRIGIYGPARWSVRRMMGKLRGLFPVNEDKMEQDVLRRLDPREPVGDDEGHLSGS